MATKMSISTMLSFKSNLDRFCAYATAHFIELLRTTPATLVSGSTAVAKVSAWLMNLAENIDLDKLELTSVPLTEKDLDPTSQDEFLVYFLALLTITNRLYNEATRLFTDEYIVKQDRKDQKRVFLGFLHTALSQVQKK